MQLRRFLTTLAFQKRIEIFLNSYVKFQQTGLKPRKLTKSDLNALLLTYLSLLGERHSAENRRTNNGEDAKGVRSFK